MQLLRPSSRPLACWPAAHRPAVAPAARPPARRSTAAGAAPHGAAAPRRRQLPRIDPAALPRPPQPPPPVLLTGATSSPGIGREVLHGLLAAGLPVVTVARNEARREALCADLRRRYGASVPVTVALCDLSSSAAVEGLARHLQQGERPFGLVINCVGAMYADYGLTAEGRERTLAVNAVAPWLLTRRLLDAGMVADGGRIVQTNSDGHRVFAGLFGLFGPATLDRASFADPERFNMEYSYGQAQLAALLLDAEQRRRLGAQGSAIRLFNYNPGWTDTELGRDFARRGPLLNFLATKIFPRFAASAAYAAAPILSLALGELAGLDDAYSTYYTRFMQVRSSPASRDAGRATALYEAFAAELDAAQ